MTFSKRIEKWRETRVGFALILIGFTAAAITFGAFVWSQIGLLRENLQWSSNYNRVFSYLIRICVFGIAAIICAIGPVAFFYLYVRKK